MLFYDTHFSRLLFCSSNWSADRSVNTGGKVEEELLVTNEEEVVIDGVVIVVDVFLHSNIVTATLSSSFLQDENAFLQESSCNLTLCASSFTDKKEN